MGDHMYQSTFNLGRTPPFPALYGSNKTPVTSDVLEIGWLTAFLTVYLCFLLLLPASVGKQRIFYAIRVTVILTIGFIVMWCNFGQEWEVGDVESEMFYKAGSNQEIHARVAVKLGLRSVNITLKTTQEPEGDLSGETINYNERFYWTWQQGRAGFGPFAGTFNRAFRAAQVKGVPYPILWVAEYFTFDGEGFRFGRHYRLAGWYTHICMWAALPVWLLVIITSKFVLIYSAFLLVLLGCLLTSASIIWANIRNFNELAILFDDTPTGVLKTTYGTHWYLSLFTGVFCIACGIMIIFMSSYNYNQLCKFFEIDPLAVLEVQHGVLEEDNDNSSQVTDLDNIEMDEIGKKREEKQNITVRIRPKGTIRHWTKKSILRAPVIPPRVPPKRRGKGQGQGQGQHVVAAVQNRDEGAPKQIRKERQEHQRTGNQSRGPHQEDGGGNATYIDLKDIPQQQQHQQQQPEQDNSDEIYVELSPPTKVDARNEDEEIYME